MSKPSLLLTGKNSGNWYIQTLEELKKNHTSFDYGTVQVEFEPINALLPNKMEEAAKLLEPYFVELEKQKQPYILANITLHEAIQYFSFVPKYFISIEAILKDESQKELGKLGVLGTKFTMNHTYIPSLLPNIELVTLSEYVQESVDQLRKRYYHSSNKTLAKQTFNHLKTIEIDSYIIACTELAVAFADTDSNLDVINLPKLQARYLSRRIKS